MTPQPLLRTHPTPNGCVLSIPGISSGLPGDVTSPFLTFYEHNLILAFAQKRHQRWLNQVVKYHHPSLG